MANDVSTVFTMENFAAFESPLPSSFETRTLEISKDKSSTRLSTETLMVRKTINKKMKKWHFTVIEATKMISNKK